MTLWWHQLNTRGIHFGETDIFSTLLDLLSTVVFRTAVDVSLTVINR